MKIGANFSLVMSVRFQANSLKLVYPPMSNQEMDWLCDIPEVREWVERSKLYMIAQRAELLFEHFDHDDATQTISFDMTHANSLLSVHWHMPVSEIVGDYEGEIEIELGPKLIRVWPETRTPVTEPLVWFTPDKLIFDATNGHLPVRLGEDLRDLMTFDLLYVGISKTGNSLTRLFETGHEARLKILTNQRQHYPTARVTDEMMLFLFDFERVGVTMLDFAELEAHFGVDHRADVVEVVADAEKAFVKTLGPEYNEVTFKHYPRGTDGLYDSGLEGYAYAIREDLRFRTPTGVLAGSVAEGSYDVIVVRGDDVEIVRPA